ncbi:MAG: hypothetical protein P1R58_03020 [bacterium]|nr:hypothetical protein [bacterium]
MKVLHLPTNIASQMSVTVRALREIGIEARGMVRDNSDFQTGDGLEHFCISSRRRNPIKGGIETFNWWRAVHSALKWADIVHWHFGDPVLPANWDLRWLQKQNKARLIEFWGSDIRSPEKAAEDNPEIGTMYQQHPELVAGSTARSLSRQKKFGQFGFSAIVTGLELSDHLHRNLFRQSYQGKPRLLLSEFSPRYPDPDNSCPVLVHAPSNKLLKGTTAVLSAVNSLKDQLPFEFRLIQNVSRSEALNVMAEADIFLDQFVIGENGLASLEAMAFGKPTVCYIKQSVAEQQSDDFPIVNATADSLPTVLAQLIEDGQARARLGREGRAFVEKYHDATKIAADLVDIYKAELAART